jgi:GST-like protein
VLGRRLAQAPYLAGEYSIADMINVTWPRAARDFLGMNRGSYPDLTRWITAIEDRPAVRRAFAMKPS